MLLLFHQIVIKRFGITIGFKVYKYVAVGKSVIQVALNLLCEFMALINAPGAGHK